MKVQKKKHKGRKTEKRRGEDNKMLPQEAIVLIRAYNDVLVVSYAKLTHIDLVVHEIDSEGMLPSNRKPGRPGW
ncbi:hypothetical protein OESDEN_07073 [Oesophagostomum dentatum]|uniref:Uncharacterized protein n=1 Tax=Oesophagostomum dentatum TaxID=61180 RepID=A0A0B1TB44_OESDE|nr:hypothetical protein OESDEN_07073 [Oesophagostomum dentatum]